VSTAGVIRIMCPNLACKRILGVPAHARGKLVRCRGCSTNIRIPMGKTAAAPGKEGEPAPGAGQASSEAA